MMYLIDRAGSLLADTPRAATRCGRIASLVGALLLLIAAPAKSPAQPIPVIFDTDMGNDVDDALALAMLHSLESRGEIDLLAVTITKDNRWAVAYVDAVDTFYGRPDIPIGVVKNGPTPEDSDMIRIPASRQRGDSLAYGHDLNDGSRAPEATVVLRQTLASSEDSSVVIVQVGFSTNLARLLESGPDENSPLPGDELVKRKVKHVVVMAGSFPGIPEYNVRIDLPAARKVLEEWPTALYASGFEVGEKILYPAASIDQHFDWVALHPVVDAYVHYLEMPYDRPTWDLTAVLFAARADGGYLIPSEPGRIEVDDRGHTLFRPEEDGNRHYLRIPENGAGRILEALIHLVSQPRTAPD